MSQLSFSLYYFLLQLFASGGGGCCDCGDPEAWTSGVYCDLHEPVQGNNQEVYRFLLFSESRVYVYLYIFNNEHLLIEFARHLCPTMREQLLDIPWEPWDFPQPPN